MESTLDQETYESSLGRALAMWDRGHHIPLDLYAELVQQGFDVPALEARHFNYDT
jgi:hypothetical protein